MEVGKARGARSFLIDSADEILPEWLEGVESAAVSSGASTPEDVVEAVLARVGELGGGPVELITTVEEDVTFSIPPSLKRDVDAMRRAAGAGSLATGGDAE